MANPTKENREWQNVWINKESVTELLKATKEKELWRDMIVNAAKHDID